MPHEKSPYRRIGDDPAFRELLGPEFDHMTADDIEFLLDAVLEAMRKAADEWAACVPYDPDLFIRV